MFLDTTLGVLADFQVLVALYKLEGPSTTVTFLGILIDTARLKLRVPLDKLARLRQLVASWLGKSSGRRLDLESLLGHLSHATVVVKLE